MLSTSDRTFEEGSIKGVVFKPLKRWEDARGWIIEMFRGDELDSADIPAMAYVSQTLPGVVRGPHEHRVQTDLFVFAGPGDFKLHLWDNRAGSPTLGNKQTVLVGESNVQAVIIPPGVVHAYRAVSQTPSVMFNCPNRLYAGEGKKEPTDEIRHEDRPDSPFVMD